MTAVNVLFAALLAAGVFAAVMGLGVRRPVSLSALEELAGGGAAARGPLGRLQFMLDNARLDISAPEFLGVSLLLALLGAGAMYLLSNAPLAALVGFAFGGLAYGLYLRRRAEKNREAYENALPSVVARLKSGAERAQSFVGAAEYVAAYGPVICRDDWAAIAARLRSGSDNLSPAYDSIVKKRGSVLLATIFELLLIQQQRNTSLVKTLGGIEESLRDRVRMMRRARVSLGGPLRELWIVCSVPFWAVFVLRLIAPGYAAIYGTALGQIILFLGWGLTIAGFVLGYRAFSNGLREETDFGGLGGEARAPLRSSDRLQRELADRRRLEELARVVPPGMRPPPGGLPDSLSGIAGSPQGGE